MLIYFHLISLQLKLRWLDEDCNITFDANEKLELNFIVNLFI